MKNRVFLFMAMLFLSHSAFASHQAWTSVQIKTIIVHDNGSTDFMGEAHVVMMSSASSRPDCPGAADRFIIDLSKPIANTQYSTVLSAYMASKPITVYLNDFCNGNTAALRNIIVGTPD